MIEFLLNQPGVWRFEPRLVADMVFGLSLNVADYLSGCDTSTEALLPNGSANPRFCFVIGKPDLTTNEFRCFHDRLDVVMVNLLKLADKLLNGAEIGVGNGAATSANRIGESLTDDAKAGASAIGNCIAEAVLDLKPSLVESLLNAVELCYCGPKTRTDELQLADIGNTLPVTAADGVVQLLFTLMSRATGNRTVNFLASTMKFLHAAGADSNRMFISDLAVYVLQRIFDTCSSRNERAFNEAGVVAILAQQLVQCSQTIDPAPTVEYSHLLKSAAAVCGRGPKTSDSGSKRISEMKVDGMTNFAPLCKFGFGDSRVMNQVSDLSCLFFCRFHSVEQSHGSSFDGFAQLDTSTPTSEKRGVVLPLLPGGKLVGYDVDAAIYGHVERNSDSASSGIVAE